MSNGLCRSFRLLRAVATVGLSIAATLATVPTSAAQSYHREELRIPFADAGPRGLEAVLIRPNDGKRYPLAVISHGSPRKAEDRPESSPNRFYTQSIEFARRGFAVLTVMRRGYGDSGGDYAENSGPCGRRDYLTSARNSAKDLRAAVEAMRKRSDLTTTGMIAVGQSAGGFASIALAADPPPELTAVISFAGGRGSRGENDVCDEDRLVEAFGTLGRTARVPMLWVYSENDLYFRPELARRFHEAFLKPGGRAQYIAAPAYGTDGHVLFSAGGRSVWLPMVDGFLRAQNIGLKEPLAPPAVSALPPPPKFAGSGKEAFSAYLQSGPHKAFAVSPTGRFAWRSGFRTADDAQKAAIEACEKTGATCTAYAVNDAIAGAGAPAR